MENKKEKSNPTSLLKPQRVKSGWNARVRYAIQGTENSGLLGGVMKTPQGIPKAPPTISVMT